MIQYHERSGRIQLNLECIYKGYHITIRAEGIKVRRINRIRGCGRCNEEYEGDVCLICTLWH